MGSELPKVGPFARLASTSGVMPDAGSFNNGESCMELGYRQTLAKRRASKDQCAIQTRKLEFCYPGIDGRPLPDNPPVVKDMTIALPAGSRCLLLGPNGAGKTTLLKVLGGKHMVPKDAVQVLGQPPFHNTELTSSGDLSYLGGNWDRDIAFAGYRMETQGDFPVSKMIDGLSDVDPKRKSKLLEVLDIDLDWRMHLVSDGQRRRVQLLMGLLKPFKVLLLDEITVDLDVLGRADLLRYLQEETEQRGAAILYATHIFDGLESWPTHLMYLAGGQLKLFEPASNFPQLQRGELLELVLSWLRKEASGKKEKPGHERKKADFAEEEGERPVIAEWSNGWASGRMTSTLKDSSNAVMRM